MTSKLCPREVNFTIPGHPAVQITGVEDGLGDVVLTATVLSPILTYDLRTLFFGFNGAKLGTLQVLAPDPYSVGLVGAPSPYNVLVNFGTPGVGADFVDSPLTVTLTDAAHDLTLDDMMHSLFGVRVETKVPLLSEKIVGIVPAAPKAHDFGGTTLEDVAITIDVSQLASSADNSPLAIDKVSQPAHGTVTIAPDGKTLTYIPMLDYANSPNSDIDTFQYCVHDAQGGEDSATITVAVTPVADPPTVTVKVLQPLPGDPVTEVRLEITANSGDFGTVDQGSDFISRIQFSGLPNGVTLTGAGLVNDTITFSGTPSSATTDVNLTVLPDTSYNFNLGITAFNDEIEGFGSPAEASATTNQSIVVDNVQTQQDLTFQTTGQSIWDSGAAFSKDYNTGFLGIDKSYGTSASVLDIASAGASVHFRAGVQADLKISAGDISATLPFNVGLDSTYNVTTDTLQITGTDAQLGGGHFTAHGPSGSFTFGLDLGLSATAHATIVGTGFNTSITIGSFTKPVYSIGVNSTQLSTTISLPGGFALTLAFPNVNTNGSNASPGTISGTGTSNDIANLSADLVAVASNILFGSDVTDINFGFGSIDILDLILGIGVNVVQKFDLNSSDLMPTLILEDGTVESGFMFGTPLTIPNASIHDTNNDGKIDFSLGLVPKATLTNNTSLGADLTAGITVLSLSVSGLGSFTAFKGNTNVQLGTFPPIYSNTFALNGFGSKTVTQTV